MCGGVTLPYSLSPPSRTVQDLEGGFLVCIFKNKLRANPIFHIYVQGHCDIPVHVCARLCMCVCTGTHKSSIIVQTSANV